MARQGGNYNAIKIIKIEKTEMNGEDLNVIVIWAVTAPLKEKEESHAQGYGRH